MLSASKRRWLRVPLLALVMVTVGVVAPAARAESFMCWGGTIKGDTYGESTDAPLDPAILERFEHDAGKKVTFINTGQGWASFDRATMDATVAEGAYPLVTMPLAEGVTLAEVAAGDQDRQIREWARQARAFGYPFLFRPWWEANGNWYSWGRNPSFIAAWRHFHDLVVEEGATNVTWAWVVDAIWSNPASDPTPYYPGDEYVDWVGLDAYNWGRNELQPDRWLTPEEAIQPTIDVLKQIAPTKPVCICEDASTEVGGDKAAWIGELLGTYLPAHPEIKAFLWFNWNVAQSGKTGRWDWPIESSPAAELAFREGIQRPMFLPAFAPMPKLTKVPMPAPPPVIAPPPSPPSLPSPPHATPAVVSLPATPTCTVPKVLGLRFRAARRRLRSADCAVGSIATSRGAHLRSARVVGQRPAPGRSAAARSKVALTLG